MAPIRQTRPTHSRTRTVLVILLVALVASIFSTSIAYQTVRNDGRTPDKIALTLLNTSFWFGWAALSLPLSLLAARWRIDRRARVAVPILVIAALIAGAIHIGLQSAVQSLLFVRSALATGVNADVVDMFLARFRYVFPMQILSLVDWELLAGMGIIALAHAVFFRREASDRALREAYLETRLIEAQLKTLQQQLHPHFLFNTLHAVSALMHRDVEAANTVLVRLSDLLRMSLDSGTQKEWRLSREIEFIDKYLQIEKARFGDRLTMDFEIEPDTFDAYVPALILQPLVENAIKHGVAPHTAHGPIEIRARKADGVLQLSVSDNGPGPVTADKVRVGGIGLTNIRSRLNHHFGELGRLYLDRRTDGFSAQVTLPFRI
jgi:two-component system LytT family sensor kinase